MERDAGRQKATLNAMSEIVWRFPAPSSGFGGVTVHFHPRREITLTFEFEDVNGTMRSGELSFKDVVHYRTTYLYALRPEMIEQAYDCVVDVGKSSDLNDMIAAMQAGGRPADIRHYQVCFDDGPFFEFFAASFEACIS
ncbi:hypothetical protein IHQ68_16295 [Chelatococcus sambhunathii]|uniref:Activator of Hsp90 ATPase homolog 1-like protein n=1 Tax=Chelatococcus sambhunathii TaxID=363953 RepID=A0ABU1DJC6_9HYPH|nr:hypothetical protein [Chelatococcus sambhunathii]MDR4308181.1 hypothetical protein [Chelatococcus sambhunathii]